MVFGIYYVLVFLAWARAYRIIASGFTSVFEASAEKGRSPPNKDRRLSAQSPLGTVTALPSLSVVIPARNEEETLPRCLKCLEDDEYPGVEIIVADDDSTDDTPLVVERFPGVRRISVDPPHDKVTGKMNAMEKGAAEAKGAWVLFLDADSCIHRGTLKESILYAEGEGCGLLSLSPHQVCSTMWEELIQSSVFSFFNLRYPYPQINDPGSTLSASNGVFLLIKKDIFDRIGGFSWAQGSLAEDMALAERVKSGGYRIAFLPTRTAISVRMYKNFAELWAGWSKHFEAFFGQGGPRALVIAGLYFLGAVLPFLCAPLIPLAGDHVVPAASLALIFYLEARLRKIQGFNPHMFLLMPLGNLVFFAILINSLRNRYVRGKVTWKGRTYGR